MAYSPKDPTTVTSLEELRDFVSDELGFISQQFGEGEKVLELTPVYRTPDKPREGMFAYADGVHWNPGSGKGTYEFDGTNWVRQGGASVPSYINICAAPYNGVGDGVTDNTAALSAAIAALPTNGGAIYFPAGKYRFNSQVSKTYPSNILYDLKLFGDGPDASVLFWPASNATFGLDIQLNDTGGPSNNQSFHAHDISLTTSATGGARTGLRLRQIGTSNGSFAAISSLNRMTFRGDSGVGGSDSWSTNFDVVNVSNVNCFDCLFHGPSPAGGIGLQYAGTSSSQVAVVLNCVGCTFNLLTSGVRLNNEFTQGLTFDSCNFTNCTNGFVIPAGVGLLNGASTAQVCFDSCQFGVGGSANGISADSTTPIAVLMCTNNLFLIEAATAAGIVAPLINSTVVGNVFQSASLTSTTGLQVTSSPVNGVNIVSENIFNGFANGIVLGSGAHLNNIGPNAFIGCTNRVSNSAVAGNGNQGIWQFPQASGYSHILGNIQNSSNAHAALVQCGPAGTADTSSIFMDFWDPSVATNYGKIRRNGAGIGIDGILWTSYTPTVTGSTGGAPTVTLSGCQFAQIGKIVYYRVDIAINAVSTATGTTKFTLPVTGTGRGYVGAGREVNTSGFMLQGVMASATEVIILKYDNTFMLAAGERYLINGTYEAA